MPISSQLFFCTFYALYRLDCLHAHRHVLHIITSAEEGGYVFSSVCLSVCLFVCLSVRLLANL